FEQGAAAIVAVMGALKAGKIYVPLDPLHFPPAKLAAMLEDSGAGLIVTDGQNLGLAERLADGARATIDLNRLDASADAENPGLPLSADRLAYILYTSGSTGEPKGVVQSHRNVLHFIRNYTNDLGVGAEDRQSLLFSCGVAGSVKNIFSALLNGAALVSLNLKAEGPARLPAWLVEERVTLCQMVPTVFRHFAGYLTGREIFPDLRALYLTGEPLFRRDVDLYKAHFPAQCVLVNTLASTELNTLRQFFITHETDIADAVVPVGYPVEDTEILLLDESGAAVGPDRVGEIAIKSRYLAVGYWHKPELTRQAFAADPEGGDKRIYRTADLGRMRRDGCLEYIGRKDFQVKIRGHRIEIGEIEAALLALGTVLEAVVVALNESAEEKRLAAYIVPVRLPAPDSSELRRALAERLPDYMIPSSFMIAESLPVSAIGKVNLRALTAAGGARPVEKPLFVAPRTPLETSLAAIWAETLGKDSVGVRDNFFDLGGHSLLAAQILSRTRDLLDIELPLTVLFEKPTIAELAEYLDRLRVETEPRR
ncbi:MAG TPA: AMP-binding protein, partial [Candidatus Binatia bacterium]